MAASAVSAVPLACFVFGSRAIMSHFGFLRCSGDHRLRSRNFLMNLLSTSDVPSSETTPCFECVRALVKKIRSSTHQHSKHLTIDSRCKIFALSLRISLTTSIFSALFHGGRNLSMCLQSDGRSFILHRLQINSTS